MPFYKILSIGQQAVLKASNIKVPHIIDIQVKFSSQTGTDLDSKGLTNSCNVLTESSGSQCLPTAFLLHVTS